jgi:RimJ/RimL family protein N-acetyltransferase
MRGEGRHFAVADLETSEMIGGINFHNIRPDHRRAEIGFWLVPGARGRGIGSAAVAAACRWAFGHFGLVRIEMTTLPDTKRRSAWPARSASSARGCCATATSNAAIRSTS